MRPVLIVSPDHGEQSRDQRQERNSKSHRGSFHRQRVRRRRSRKLLSGNRKRGRAENRRRIRQSGQGGGVAEIAHRADCITFLDIAWESDDPKALGNFDPAPNILNHNPAFILRFHSTGMLPMRDFSVRPLCFLIVLALSAATRLVAEDPDLANLKKEAAAALEKKTQAEKSLKAIEAEQTALKTKLIQTKAAPAQAQRTQTEAEAALKKQQEELKKAQAALDAAITQADGDREKSRGRRQIREGQTRRQTRRRGFEKSQRGKSQVCRRDRGKEQSISSRTSGREGIRAKNRRRQRDDRQSPRTDQSRRTANRGSRSQTRRGSQRTWKPSPRIGWRNKKRSRGN